MDLTESMKLRFFVMYEDRMNINAFSDRCMDDVRTTFRCIRGSDSADSTTVDLSDKTADGVEDFNLDLSRLRVGIPREYRHHWNS